MLFETGTNEVRYPNRRSLEMNDSPITPPLGARAPGVATKSAAEMLSDREREVFRHLGEGLGTRRIAELLDLSPKTVQTYHARIKKKLRIGSFTELLCEAARWQAQTSNEAR
jgi:DNA-binding CsgD family transcriptional regulator